jgi:hypothetical protein
MPEANGNAGQPSTFDLDVQIAAGIGAKLISSAKAVEALSKAFTGQNATKMVAMFMAQLVERVQDRFDDSETPLDPSIWFAEGGVLDELGDELSDIAQSVGAEFTKQTMDEIKQQVMAIGQQRASQMDGEQAPAEESAPRGFLGGM